MLWLQPKGPSLERVRDARIVVTGATGFLGRHLCERLEAGGAQVITLQRSNATRALTHAKTLTLDLADRRAVGEALARLKPDIVYHLAGHVTPDRSAHAMPLTFDANLLPTANILFAAAEARRQPRVVITTSLETSDPWARAANTGSPYGVSKLLVEILAGGMHLLQNTNCVTARVGMAYGPNDPNRRRLVPAVIGALLAAEAPRLGSGRRRCDWIYIDDVVNGLLALGGTPKLNAPAVDLGSGELTSVRRVAQLICSLFGSDIGILYDAQLDRPNEQERAADIAASLREIGWQPQIGLIDGLTRTIAWQRARKAASKAAQGTRLNREGVGYQIAAPGPRTRAAARKVRTRNGRRTRTAPARRQRP
jgi:UDP-glucose 4-epimerase